MERETLRQRAACGDTARDKIPEIQWRNIDNSIQYQCSILKFKYNLCDNTHLRLSAHPAPGPLLPLALLVLLAGAALVITQGLLLAPGRGRLPPPALGTSAIVSWLELETKVHTKVQNHGEGPYKEGLVSIDSQMRPNFSSTLLCGGK